MLNVELELKAEKDNAKVRVDKVEDYQSLVDAEWQIIYKKLDACIAAGVQIVLSRLAIGDLATQYVVFLVGVVFRASDFGQGILLTEECFVLVVFPKTIWLVSQRQLELRLVVRAVVFVSFF